MLIGLIYVVIKKKVKVLLNCQKPTMQAIKLQLKSNMKLTFQFQGETCFSFEVEFSNIRFSK